MEQERKIEKWLRSYAKKRRGQAGESFKLDPATRHILQSEVSRNAPGTGAEEEDDSMSLWQVFRQQWVYLLGFAACIFVIASFFFQTLNKAKTRAELAATTANLREIGAATHVAAVDNGGTLPATLDALTNGYLSAREISQIKDGKAITYTAGGMKLSNLPNNAVVAYSKDENNRRGVVLADGSVHYMSEANFESLTNSRAPEIASDESAMAPPAAASPPAGFGGGYSPAQVPSQKVPQMAVSGGGMLYLSSRKVETLAENSFKNTIAPPAQSSPVLVNFQVSQNGNVIRVVDQDGSVYSGVLRTEGQEINAASDEGVAADKVQQNTANSTLDIPKMGALPASGLPVPPGQAAQASQGYAFRVEGMNKTLKQSVLFTGTLLGDLSMAQNVQQSFGWTANAAVGATYAQQMMKSEQTNRAAQAAQLPWSRLRINGTAIINLTNRIEVNAMPVPPATKAGNIK
jgi:hypothetical protein